MFISRKRLSELGMLGMNRRNIEYIGRYNPRAKYKLVDDKLTTKKLALDNGIATPDLIGVVAHQHDIYDVAPLLFRQKAFVIKPAQGSGGKGILVITKVENNRFYKASGDEVTIETIHRHLSNTLSGLFTLGGKPDVAVIEDLIQFDPVFEGYSYEGVPDLRLIVFQGFPVMGMLRLSTHDSDGKANLHQGAVGVGLDIATGKAIHAVQFDQRVSHHPDTKMLLCDIQVPHWESMLHLASRCYDMCGLGYLGTDLVLDKRYGPQVLELNARPGLAIQIANGKGLLPRLKQVESLKGHSMTVEQRIDYAKLHFGQN